MPWRKILFFLLIFFCLTPYASPPAALALGLLLSFSVGNPYAREISKPTKFLLQFSVVLLGFGMNLTAVVEAGKSGILFTIATIFGTLLLGFLLGKLLKVKNKPSTLVSAGPAICGGSAIAAAAPAIEADPEDVSLSFATIFVLNSAALFVFPVVGHFLDLTPHQFGVWAAIAIHDTSSVVGAASRFGDEALQIAATVKLTRALWIFPVVLVLAMFYRSKKADKKLKVVVPWFIFLFLLAVVARTYAPSAFQPSLFESFVNLAKAGLTVTLFLIGASLSRATLKTFGFRALLQGVLLWLVISLISLWAVLKIL